MHYQAFYEQILREASTTNEIKENAKPSKRKETAKSSRRSAQLLTREAFGAWTAVIDCRQRRPRPARGAWDRSRSVTNRLPSLHGVWRRELLKSRLGLGERIGVGQKTLSPQLFRLRPWRPVLKHYRMREQRLRKTSMRSEGEQTRSR